MCFDVKIVECGYVIFFLVFFKIFSWFLVMLENVEIEVDKEVLGVLFGKDGCVLVI